MALTITSLNLNPAGGSTAPAQRSNAASLKFSLTSITVGVAGDYSAGGIVLTPVQLGMDSQVLGGWAAVLTAAGTSTVVQCVLDCTNPAAPKLKLNAVAAEAVGAGVAGDVILVYALGM